MSTDKTTNLDELKQLVVDFRNQRNWGVHHTPKNLAISISIEAAELLEHFQWDNYTESSKEEVQAELADILIYCFNFAETLDIDIATAFREKLDKAAIKYPLSKFASGKGDSQEYKKVKQAYRQPKG